MGIKFYCPNGHKLNVKSFLSGKKAICPKCGAKVMVPAEGAADGADQGGNGSLEPGTAFAPRLADAAFGAEAASPHGAGPSYVASAEHPVQPGNPATSPGIAMTDPIDEAPAAVWYVRPPSGGQFGPAAGPTMRSWVQEGRVTANSLVWRDGWPDWRSAAATFPSLAASQPAWGGGVAPAVGGMPVPQAGAMPLAAPVNGWQQPGALAQQPGMAPVGMPLAQQGAMMGHVMSALETPLGGYEAPMSDELPSRRKRRAKKGPDITTYIAVALVVMTVVLVVVLAVVLIKQSGGAADEAPAPASKNAASEAGDEEMSEGPAAEEGEAEAKPKPKKGKKAKAKAAGEENM